MIIRMIRKLRHKSKRVISYLHEQRFLSSFSKVKNRIIHKIIRRFAPYKQVWHKLFSLNFINSHVKVEIDFEQSYELLNKAYKHEGIQGLTTWVNRGVREAQKHCATVNHIAYQVLKDQGNLTGAIQFGKQALQFTAHNSLRGQIKRGLFKRYNELGAFSKAISQLADERKYHETDYYKRLLDHLTLLKQGFNVKGFTPEENYQTNEQKVLYLINCSLPYITNGYTIRTHYLLSALAKHQIEMTVLTRYGFPADIDEEAIDIPEVSPVNALQYHHISDIHSGYKTQRLTEYLRHYIEKVIAQAKITRPTIIHCASNFINGLVGTTVAKALNIPVIYEVRGLWEITRASRDPQWQGSEHFEMMKRLEIQAACQADKVLTLTKTLKNELISRGIPAEKIDLLPNGVDCNYFKPVDVDAELAQKLNLGKREVIIGFIGSIIDYEGLDHLIQAISLLKCSTMTTIKLLIVGDGIQREALIQLTHRLGMKSNVIFTGKVPHEQVIRYYSLFDIAVYPRKSLLVCELVSPLKPFEAMSMAKPILVSSVAVLKEIVEESRGGLVFEKNNVNDLAQKLGQMVRNKLLRRKLGLKARQWVCQNRDWLVLSKQVKLLYKELHIKHNY